jgi:sugar phosphate isomerase/epimerase
MVQAQPGPSAATAPAQPELRVPHAGLSKLAWQFVMPSTALGDPTVTETIEHLHALNVHHIELVPGQVVSPDERGVKVGVDLSDQDVATLLAKLKTVKMDFVSYGPVTDLGTSEADLRKVFELGRKLKVKNIVCSPTADTLPLLDKLAGEYKINVAIMNSPGGSATYKDCDALLAALDGRSARIAVCGDLGQWKNAGESPVECVKKLGPHLVEVRLTDVNAQGEAVPVGSGAIDADAILSQLKAQHFKGAITVGPAGPGDRLVSFARSVNAMSDIVTRLAGD